MKLWSTQPRQLEGRPDRDKSPSRDGRDQPSSSQSLSLPPPPTQRSSPFPTLQRPLDNESPRTLPPPTPSLSHIMTPSRSAPYSQPSDWGPSFPPPSSRPSWATQPISPGQGSYGSSTLAPLMDRPPSGPPPGAYRPHTSYYPHHPPPTASSTQTIRPHSSVQPTEDGGDDNGSGKKKKRRVALACAECAKRKQRCNRETPCQHCIARRVPELCVPYTRSGTPPPRGVKLEPVWDRKTSPKEASERPTLPTLSVRMARVEDLLNLMVNSVPAVHGSKALEAWRINHPPATSPGPDLGLEDNEEDTAPTPSEPYPEGPIGTKEAVPETEDVGRLDSDTAGRNPLPQSMIRSTQPVPRGLDSHGSPAEQLQKLFHDCGLQPQKIQDLVNDLPPFPLASRLVDWFFEKFNFVRYPIDETLFRQAFRMVYEHGNIDSVTVLALPLVFIALAIAMRIAPESWAGTEATKKTQSLKLYWNSKTAIIIASAVKTEHLQLVETHILTGLYLILMHERRLAEGWSAFRAGLTTGQAIGLHRDGAKLGLEPVMTEYRRRLWSYLLHADATYSCLLGRPTSIDPNCVDTLPPSNTDIDILRIDPRTQPKPIQEPTYGTYLLLRYKLGIIVAKIARIFQELGDSPSYRDVEEVDDDFQTLIDDLPPAFRMLDFDRKWDTSLWYLPTHRYYIQTEILHFRIILHRPWMLRKLHSERHRLSRTVTEQSSVTDYKIRKAFKRDVPDFFETLLGGSFRSFNVAMIAGVSLIMNPQAPYATEMKDIIRLFMEQHPCDSAADDFTRQEATIIATLHRRHKEVESRRIASAAQASAARIAQDSKSTNPHNNHSQSDLRSTSDQYDGRQDATSMFSSDISSGQPLHSPEDDYAQDILNQYIAHPSYGPGADLTLGPFGMYPAQIRPYSQPQPFGQDSSLAYPQQQDPNAQPMLMLPNKGPSWVNYDVENGLNGSGSSNGQIGLGLNRNMGPLMGTVGGEQTEQLWENLVNALPDPFGQMPA